MTQTASYKSRAAALACWLGWTVAGGCQAIATFDTSHITEDDRALCSDQTDNDGNGLADCQDFGCLGVPVCCTIPTVEIEDDFECSAGLASCDEPCAPDDEVWQAWGAPSPVVCEGALSPNKVEQCYDVGVLSREPVLLQPGLSVAAIVAGVPEQRGRLEVGVTLQEQVAGGDDPCAPLETVIPVISVAMLAGEGGYRMVARFDGTDVGVSRPFEDGEPRDVSISIREDRRVYYEVEGDEFARSPADSLIPASGLEARVSLSGRGRAAGFEKIAVTVGTQCDDPLAWERAPEDLAGLAPSVSGWDSYAVRAPAVSAAGDRYELYYTGCGEKLGDCDPLIAGLGYASAEEDLTFSRSGDACPLVGAPALVCDSGMENPFADRFNNLIDAAPVDYGGSRLILVSQLHGGKEIRVLRGAEDPSSLEEVLGGGIRSGSAGEWDEHEICCPAALEIDGELRVWYAGRAGPAAPWSIGLASSSDGVTFEKDPQNPLLAGGGPGAFDEGGVGAPAVVHDRGLYRMWYEAAGFFGAMSIGYAVSVDGVLWHKLPGNPAVQPSGVGLTTVGGPSVIVDGDRLIMALEGEAEEAPSRRIYGLVNRGGTP